MTLVLDRLRSGYGGGTVVHGVGLRVRPGRVHALVGANGAGKSTVLDTVAGLVPATGGEIRLADVDLTRMPAHRRAGLGLGYVPQGARVFPSLTVAEHLVVPRRTGSPDGWNPARIHDLLPELARRRRQRAGTLSGGERQLLALARALLVQPRVLLLDEPTEGLAPLVVDRFRRLVPDLAADGIGVLLATPQPDFAIALADEFTVLAAGRVVQSLTADVVRAEPHRLTAALSPLGSASAGRRDAVSPLP